MFARQAPQAAVFGAENERQRPFEPRRLQRRRRFRIEADAPIAEIAELAHRSREVGHRADRHVLEAAGGGLGERAGEFGRVPLGRHQRVDGEGGAGAQDRADVVRIGDLVEHDDEAVGGQLGDVDRLQRPRFEQDALVDRVAWQALGDLLGRCDARFDPAGGDLRREALGGGWGDVEPHQLAPRRLERRRHAVEPVDAHHVARPP